MTVPSPDRIETARLIGRTVGSSDGREFLRRNGHGPGVPIIACEWDTRVAEVVERVRASGASSMVAVAIRRDEELKWMSLVSSKGEPPSGPSVHGDGTMGMLYQATRNEGRLSVQVTNLTAAHRMLAPA